MPDELRELTVHIVSAYLSNNPTPRSELARVIADVSTAVAGLSQPAEEIVEKPAPAVNPKRSVFPDYIISLEDGRRFKSLKRPLMSRHGLTPEQYREKWGLPFDYPMVAPNYAAQRSALAKELGLGRKPKAVAAHVAKAQVSPQVAVPSKTRGRPAKTVDVPAEPVKPARTRTKKVKAD